MNKPQSPYRHFVLFDVHAKMHRLDGNAVLPELICGAGDWPFARETDGVKMWITQEQLIDIPLSQWCPACMAIARR